ncbi:MAG: hypothetical protein LGR52_02365 [Candidatus Thiosymbion ectosymbiont of Robbea hypermnestra]|nr:hypothetical protein [Candidatus Thiosymbion ectosymbiont of Robbea hypermnestra]
MNGERDDKSRLKGAAAIEGMAAGLAGIRERLRQVWGRGGTATGQGEAGADRGTQGRLGLSGETTSGKDPDPGHG